MISNAEKNIMYHFSCQWFSKKILGGSTYQKKVFEKQDNFRKLLKNKKHCFKADMC